MQSCHEASAERYWDTGVTTKPTGLQFPYDTRMPTRRYDNACPFSLLEQIDYLGKLNQVAGMEHWAKDSETARLLSGTVRRDHV